MGVINGMEDALSYVTLSVLCAAASAALKDWRCAARMENDRVPSFIRIMGKWLIHSLFIALLSLPLLNLIGGGR